ncbi:uncharacterized protein LOC114580563 [Dendrobium catenatum]|uniref:uncharacterized protein LOC114580563 n=1 Tax=Dendrobium catenatum TaxID=906689 RepID=UPI00109F4209|nr:uncharacterized protein LOC114580563 [Dendrobium catenatum]
MHFGGDLATRVLDVATNSDAGRDVPELIRSSHGATVAAMAYLASFPVGEYYFNWLKKLKLHPRENLFWWRIFRDAIPTNAWLYRRNLSDTHLCPWGCDSAKTTDHFTAHCSHLRSILGCLAKWGMVLPLFDSFDEVKDSLRMLAGSNPLPGKLYCYAVYQSWRARNAKKHGRQFGSPKVIAATVISQIPNAFHMPPMEQWCINQPIGLPLTKLWCTPPLKWLKVNFDASLLPSNRAGLGIVVRDDLGRLIVAASKMIEHWDTTTVELLAALMLREVLEDWMLDCEGLVIEGDSANAIKWLQDLCDPWNPLFRREDNVDVSFLCNFRQVIFQFIPRLSNRPADYCASLAIFGSFIRNDVSCNLVPSNFVDLLKAESDMA